MRAGKRNLITDVAGLRVGHAEDAALRSGCTVLLGGAVYSAVSVMGGAPGTRETDLLAPDRLVQEVDAITLSVAQLWAGCCLWCGGWAARQGAGFCGGRPTRAHRARCDCL